MRLQEQIKALQKGFFEQTPAEVIETMQGATQKLVDSGLAESSLKAGDKTPDFSLPNAESKLVSSADLLGKGPLVINFYRGAWCPYCNLELKAFQDILPEISSLGAQLVAISPNLPDESLSTIEKHALAFEVLSDIGNGLSRAFGLVFTLDSSLQPLYQKFGIDLEASNGDSSFELPIPATYVVNTDGTIALAFVDADYSKRLEPAEVVASLRSLGH